jgi:hypothetical protein
MHTRMTLAVLCALCASACTQNAAPTTQASAAGTLDTMSVATMSVELKALESKVESLNSSLAQANENISQLQRQYVLGEFTPSDNGYQQIDSGLFRFAVSVQDVAPFADGVKVKLNLGNVMYAGVSGVTLHMTYGEAKPTDINASIATWWGGLKTKTVELPNTLAAGNWNPVFVVLPGIDPKHFGYLSISMDTKSVFLTGK